MKNEITIFHGSEKIIETPIFGAGKPYNDYGRGFYCTESPELAREWAVSKDRDGFAIKYKLNTKNLSILNLNSKEYTILHWLAILVNNRQFDIQSDFGNEAKSYLLSNFLPDYESYDIIIGYRADDSYFSFAQDFLNNTISLKTLSRAMLLGNLGEQIVLKSKRAFDNIRFINAEPVSSLLWYPRKENRDSKARKQYHDMRNEKWKRGDLYIMQLLDEEIKEDDERIRRNITE